MGAIYRREMGAYFTSAVAYIFLAVFYFYSGLQLKISSLYYGTSDMSSVYSGVMVIIVFLIPILTMRLFSEDKKQKTEQCILTAPVKLGEMVMGKYLAALTLYTAAIAIFFVYALVLSYFGPVSWAIVLSNFLALFLIGAAFISVGTFVSALTENQMIAAVVSFIILLAMIMVDQVANVVNISFIKNILTSLSFYARYGEFIGGLFNLSSVLFFISTAVIFNFLTVRIYEKRRWG